MTADDFIEAGDEIVVPMCLHGRLPGTDSVIEQRIVAVWTLRNGKALRVRYYDDRADALEAVGLSEQDAHADS
jgi:ketosteroid isomerase-like protein